MATVTEKRWSWNQPICFDCYELRYPGRQPVHLKADAFELFVQRIERCVDCGRLTIEGIFMRVDPAEAKFPTHEKD